MNKPLLSTLTVSLAVISSSAMANQPSFMQLLNHVEKQSTANTNSVSQAPQPNTQFIIKYKTTSSYNTKSSQSRKQLDEKVKNFVNNFSHNQSRSTYATGTVISYARPVALDANYVVKANKAMSKAEEQQLIDDLMATGEVEYAEVDAVFQLNELPNDPLLKKQWSLGSGEGGMNIKGAWDIATGKGVTVAVLDSGITYHKDLVNNLLPGYDMISMPWRSKDGDGRDDDPTDAGTSYKAGECGSQYGKVSTWHGTTVASTIAAQANNGIGVVGSAYDAKIVPVRVAAKCGGNLSDIIDGVIWASGGKVGNIPTNENPADVINMSLGYLGWCGPSFRSAVKQARKRGSIIVASAGNEGRPASMSTPANCAGVISVGATNFAGDLTDYTNYGDDVDILAPGGDGYRGVWVATNHGVDKPIEDEGYTQVVGTSFSSPFVAGIIAQILEVKPHATQEEVLSILQDTARKPLYGCDERGCGGGIVDATKALQKALASKDAPSMQAPIVKTFNNISGSLFSWNRFDIDVPTGAKRITVTTGGGTGNPSLMLKSNGQTSLFGSDCKSNFKGTSEVCTIDNPQAGTMNIGLFSVWTFSDVNVKAVIEF